MRNMQLIIASLLLCAALVVKATPAARGPVQYQKQTEYGTYKFGYDTGDQFRQEHRGFDGVVHGRYGYRDANGKLRYVEYEAGPFGYRVKGDTGADDVPVSPTKIGSVKTHPSKPYKAPTDQELTDVEAGLAEIKRQQLFGVPVQPYIKGYVGSPPPQQVKEVIVQEPIAPPPRPPPPPPPPPPKIEQQVIVVPPPPPPPRIEQQVILAPPPAKIEQVVIPPPQKTIFQQPVVHDGYVKGYVPPIAPIPPQTQIRVIPPTKTQIYQHPVTPYVKGYVVTPAPSIKVVPVQQQVIVQKPLVVPVKTAYVKTRPPTEVVKVVQHPYIFQQPITQTYIKGYVHPTPAPVVRVIPPTKQQIFVKPVTPYTKGYVNTPPPQVVVVSRPKVVERPVQVVYQKGQVKTPQRVVVQAPHSVKGYVPPINQVKVVTSRPKIFEQPVVHDGYVKGYVQQPPQSVNPLRRGQVCNKCRYQNPKGTFPQSVAREYVFSRPVQPYVKGYSGTPSPSRKTVYRPSSTKGKTFRRVVQPSSSNRQRGEEGVVWIPAPNNRYRDNTEYYDPPPPAYAYAPY